jgi:predicted RNase H-like nuclease (RuvC/YqgF family)
MDILAFLTALFALTFALVSRRNAQDKVSALESDLDALENRNRQLVENRDALKTSLSETTSTLEATRKSLEASEQEKQEIERQRATLAETAARLEKLRADLEADLVRLRREHESLEFRVVEFQGTWSHQLSTLEAEISTLMRQLGEFRKGTQLPFVRPDLLTTSGNADAAFKPAFAPRLAEARPRAVSADAAVPAGDPAAPPVRRVP